FMQFVIGFECATEGDYVLRGYGASAYAGVFNEYCGIREMAPYMFGYIVADYFVTLNQIGEVSKGGYETVFWAFANPLDFLDSLIKAMVLGTSIVLIGMYYGYKASGGPGGGGTA